MVDDNTAISELVRVSPGLIATELRDALRHAGRTSITTADVLRTLTGSPHLFQRVVESWFPANGDARGVSAPSQLPPLYDWQREALDAWRAAGSRGVVEAVTGTGKTTVGITAAIAEVGRGGQVVVVVPTRELQSQWHGALAPVVPAGTMIGLMGDGYQDSLANHDLVIAVVNSARDGDLSPRRPGGLLIADECHRYASSENRRALNEGLPRRLGLSATLARPDDGHLAWLMPYFGTVCYRLGYERARNDGVIAPFDVTLVCLEITDEERAIYDEQTDLMSRAAAVLIGRFNLPTEPFGAFIAAVSALARTDGDESLPARRYLAALHERRRVLDEAKSKLTMLRELAPAVRDAERTLVFTSRIAASERAASMLVDLGVPAATLHSNLPTALRRERMDAFRDGRFKALVAPQVLDEGIDVPSADLAIVLGTSRSRRQMVQRMGRIVRRKSDGRRARFVVGYVVATIEDPVFGAHESFLDEVSTVATRLVSHVPHIDGWDQLVAELAPWPNTWPNIWPNPKV